MDHCLFLQQKHFIWFRLFFANIIPYSMEATPKCALLDFSSGMYFSFMVWILLVDNWLPSSYNQPKIFPGANWQGSWIIMNAAQSLKVRLTTQRHKCYSASNVQRCKVHSRNPFLTWRECMRGWKLRLKNSNSYNKMPLTFPKDDGRIS